MLSEVEDSEPAHDRAEEWLSEGWQLGRFS